MTKFKRRERPGAPTTHGAFSENVQLRYSDLRTKEGQRLHAATQGLIADLGGLQNVNAAQGIIIENIKSKLIVLFQISNYADRQKDLVDATTGELLPCLGRNFLSYSEALRRDLESLKKFSSNQLPADLYEKWRSDFFKDAIETEKGANK